MQVCTDSDFSVFRRASASPCRMVPFTLRSLLPPVMSGRFLLLQALYHAQFIHLPGHDLVLHLVHHRADEAHPEPAALALDGQLLQVDLLDRRRIKATPGVHDLNLDLFGIERGLHRDLTRVVRPVGVLDDVGAGFVHRQFELHQVAWAHARALADLAHEVPDHRQILGRRRHVQLKGAFHLIHGQLSFVGTSENRCTAAGRSARISKSEGKPNISNTWYTVSVTLQILMSPLAARTSSIKLMKTPRPADEMYVRPAQFTMIRNRPPSYSSWIAFSNCGAV